LLGGHLARLHPPPRLSLLPCSLCEAGQAPAILESDANGACTYTQCGQPSALGSGAAPAPAPNAAAMAAPAIVLTLLIVAFVEVLMHFC
jgi:hypothetical protein